MTRITLPSLKCYTEQTNPMDNLFVFFGGEPEAGLGQVSGPPRFVSLGQE